MTRRRGVSLVELLTVMSGLAVLLSLCAVLMHGAMQTQARSRSVFDGERAAMRLADQFRADVHLARDVELADDELADGAFARLELPEGETVEYRREEAHVVRVLSRDDVAVARESFPVAAVSKLSIDELASPRRIELTIAADPNDSLPSFDRPPPGLRESPVSFQVVAVVGRQWRHAPASVPQEKSP